MGDELRGGVFRDRGRPASDDSISSLERSRSIEVPPVYRAFLLEGDGARFRQHNEIEGTWHGGVRELFSIEDPCASDRRLKQALNVYHDRIPTEFLAIGDDLAGNLICIGVSGDCAGELFFWDHEMEAEEGDPPTMENMERLAGSFSEFLGKIKLI
jgi:hypothetical protein